MSCESTSHHFNCVEITPYKHAYTPTDNTLEREFLMFCVNCGLVRALLTPKQ